MPEEYLQLAFEIKASCDEISRRLLRWHWEQKPGSHTFESLLEHLAQRRQESPIYYDRLPGLESKTSWQQLDTTLCMRVLLDPEEGAAHPLDLLGNTPHPAAARRACNAVRTARNEAAHAGDRAGGAQAAILFNEAVECLEQGYAGTAFTVRDLEGFYRQAEEYLARVGSGLAGKGKNLQELLTSMRLVRGPRENTKPLNIALMMFNDRPENFFPYSRIELVVKSDPAGNDMRERVCSGPVDWQLRCALEFLRNNIIEERVRKVDGRAEAERVFNYPFEAVEEALVNAVYHKDYQIHEPVTVIILPDSLEILSFPGPDPSIPDEAVSDLNMRSTYCRNKRLGDFLKEERLAEGRNTGMGKIVQAVERNGSELPEYITDANRTFLRVVFPIHPRFTNGGVAGTSHRSRKRSQEEMESMKDEILDMLANRGALSTKEIYTVLGYSTVTSGFRRCIADLMDEGLVEYVYPESPRSSRQKLRLSVRRRIP